MFVTVIGKLFILMREEVVQTQLIQHDIHPDTPNDMDHEFPHRVRASNIHDLDFLAIVQFFADILPLAIIQ